MKFRFPLTDVSIEFADSIPSIEPVTYSDQFSQLNQRQFFLHVPQLADFYVEAGHKVLLSNVSTSDPHGIELYLNGTVLGIILHQRKILALHASGFQLQKKTILVCGESGFGKSSLTATAVTRFGAGFLADDIAALERKEFWYVKLLSDRIKLWEDTVEKLNLKREGLETIRTGVAKFIHHEKQVTEPTPLSALFFIEKTKNPGISIVPVTGSSKFQLLHEHIYRKEYLDGMKDAKVALFGNMLSVCNEIPFYHFSRSEDSDLFEATSALVEFANNLSSE